MLLNYIIIPLLSIVLFALPPQSARADAPLQFFDGLGKNTADSFSGTNIFYHLSAIAATPLLIRSGFDARVHDAFRDTSSDAIWPGAVIGSGAAALVSGLWLYSSGQSAGSQDLTGAAFVIGQASLITLTYVTFLKSLTGRAHPTNTLPLSSQEQSEKFEFGFQRLGVGYGWPSGHVSHTVAVTTALAYYYPHKTWLKWFSLGLSTYMLYTVSAFDGGQMHWFSDGVAGAFIGYTIGSSVGKNFRTLVDGTSDKVSTVSWFPVVGADYLGAAALVHF